MGWLRKQRRVAIVSDSNRVIEKSMPPLESSLKILAPEHYFFAGGSYVIPGKYSALNKYIAQPTLDQIEELVAGKLKIGFHRLEGGGTLQKNPGGWVSYNNFNGESFSDHASEIEHFKNLKYEYFDLVKDYNNLDGLFAKASENYFSILERRSVKPRWLIRFMLYEDLRIENNGNIVAGCLPTTEYVLKSKAEVPIEQELICHLDRALFSSLLQRKAVWNVSLSGSVVLFERTPNKFIPDVPYSLNFFAV